MADTHSAESILLRMGYADTINTCTLNKTFASVCMNPDFWVRKAQAVYGTDLSFTPSGLSNSNKYKWLEEHEKFMPSTIRRPTLNRKTVPNVLPDLAGNGPFWAWRAKREFHISQHDWDTILKTDPTMGIRDSPYTLYGILSSLRDEYYYTYELDNFARRHPGIANVLLYRYGPNEWYKSVKKPLYDVPAEEAADAVMNVRESLEDLLLDGKTNDVLKYLVAFNDLGRNGALYVDIAFNTLSPGDAQAFASRVWNAILSSPHSDPMQEEFIEELSDVRAWMYYIQSGLFTQDMTEHKLDVIEGDDNALELGNYLKFAFSQHMDRNEEDEELGDYDLDAYNSDE